MTIRMPDGTLRASNYSRSLTAPGERGCVQWDGAFVAPHHREHLTAWFTDWWYEADDVIAFVFTGEIECRHSDARPLESLARTYDWSSHDQRHRDD